MQAFVHIGMDKTGSSYLQILCKAFHRELRDVGIFYPAPASPVEFSHANFARALGFGYTKEDKEIGNRLVVDQALGPIPKLETLLLSSEVFSISGNPALISKLKQWLAEKGYSDVKIILYLRNQVDLYMSLYAESLKWGTKHSCEEFYPMARFRLFYDRLVQGWSEVFGAENVIVRNYDRSKVVLANEFLTIVGVPEPLKAEMRAHEIGFTNVTPPQILMEYIRTIDFAIARNELYHFIVNRIAMQRAKNLPNTSSIHVWRLPAKLVTDLELFDQVNAKISKTHRFLSFEPLKTYADEYTKLVQDISPATLQKLALFLLIDMNAK